MKPHGIPYDFQGQTHYLSGSEFRSVAATHSHEEYGFGVVYDHEIHGQVRTVTLLIGRMRDHEIADVMNINKKMVERAIETSRCYRTWRWTETERMRLLSLSHLGVKQAASVMGRTVNAVKAQRNRIKNEFRQLKAL